jgi:tetratricopeptide (TPR) repeat protein
MRLEFLYAKTGGGEPLSAFTHSLTRDVAYESLPTARRRVLHGAIARALEAIYADRLAEVYDRLAYQYGRTDEADKAVLYLTRLADKAVGAHAHTEAVRILEEARGHVDRLPAGEQDRRRVELALAQATAMVSLGAFQDLVTLLLRHQAALESLDDPRLAGPYHFLLGRSYLFLGDQRQASHHLELGLVDAMRAGDDATRGRIHYILALHGAMSGHPRDGLEHGRQAVALLERAGERGLIGPAHWSVGLNHAVLGEFEAALAAEAQAIALGAEVGDPQVLASAAWASGLVWALQGDAERAIRSCEEALALSPDPLNSAAALGWLGHAWLEVGDLGQAIPRLEEAVRLHGQFGFRQAQAWFSVFLAEAQRRASRLETALELASEGLELARGSGALQGIGWAERTLGHIAQARGATRRSTSRRRSAPSRPSGRASISRGRGSIWRRSPGLAAAGRRAPAISPRPTGASRRSASPAGRSAPPSAPATGASRSDGFRGDRRHRAADRGRRGRPWPRAGRAPPGRGGERRVHRVPPAGGGRRGGSVLGHRRRRPRGRVARGPRRP